MLSVYDLSCNDLRDPRGMTEPLVLSWRLGSTRQGAHQASYHVVVTSMKTGDCCWDSGRVEADENKVVYAGRQLTPGELCVWFVMVEDDAGAHADSVPAAFGIAMPGEPPSCASGPQRRWLVWTSDEELNDNLESRDMWETLQAAAGLRLADHDERHVLISSRLVDVSLRTLSFAQASVLLSLGLVLVRWTRTQRCVTLEVTLPPGMQGKLEVENQSHTVSCGQHTVTACVLNEETV